MVGWSAEGRFWSVSCSPACRRLSKRALPMEHSGQSATGRSTFPGSEGEKMFRRGIALPERSAKMTILRITKP
jgi:hypothetical protein